MLLIATGANAVTSRLDAIRSSEPCIDALAVISIEGIILALSHADDDAEAADEERLAMMAAAMLALGDRIADELRRGSLQQVIIKGVTGYALLSALNEKAMLCALFGEDANIGLILLDIQRTAKELRELV